MNLTLHFDGACEPRNPGGTGSWGWVLHGWPGQDPPVGLGSIPAAPTTTNNVAEFIALGKGLRWLADRGGLSAEDTLTVRGDSKLVIEQLLGRWECRAANLRPLLARCKELLKGLGAGTVRAEWVPREKNAEADALSVRAWEEATGRPFPHRPRKEKKDAAPQPAQEPAPGKADPPATAAQKCRWCDRPAEFLCDQVIATDPKAKRPEDRVKTCSAPMCRNHRTVVGSGIACTRGKGCQVFSVDRCPEHAPPPKSVVLPAPVANAPATPGDAAGSAAPAAASGAGGRPGAS